MKKRGSQKGTDSIPREFHECLSCGHEMEKWHMFCMKCGGKNFKWSILSLQAQGYASPERARQILCSGWHTVAYLEMTAISDLREHLWILEHTFPFCPMCGVRILKIGIH